MPAIAVRELSNATAIVAAQANGVQTYRPSTDGAPPATSQVIIRIDRSLTRPLPPKIHWEGATIVEMHGFPPTPSDNKRRKTMQRRWL